MSALPDIHVRCLVVGGGPAGMMTGYLLARAGVDVVVLEKHAHFNRDFRGDTIHPSTLELLHELGLLEAFLKLPHQEVHELRGSINGEVVPIADSTSATLPNNASRIVGVRRSSNGALSRNA